jgi:hypothetical protein
MNKLLILLLLSTPLFAQVDLIVIEDKELVIEGYETELTKEGYQKIILRRMIFYSDGNYATIRENQAYYANNDVVTKGVWRRAAYWVQGKDYPNDIVVNAGGGSCQYLIDKIADTYIFRQFTAFSPASEQNCISPELRLKESDWSKANLPQKLDEYKMEGFKERNVRLLKSLSKCEPTDEELAKFRNEITSAERLDASLEYKKCLVDLDKPR